jgi:hypothetical protein
MKGRGTSGKAFFLLWTGRYADAVSELELLVGLAALALEGNNNQ